MIATPAKLRDGSWGARVQGPAKVGDIVTITTKAGKSWPANVTQILWSGEGVTLCSTASLTAPRRSQVGHGRGCGCDDDCCAGGCRYDKTCNCRGGNIYDC